MNARFIRAIVTPTDSRKQEVVVDLVNPLPKHADEFIKFITMASIEASALPSSVAIFGKPKVYSLRLSIDGGTSYHDYDGNIDGLKSIIDVMVKKSSSGSLVDFDIDRDVIYIGRDGMGNDMSDLTNGSFYHSDPEPSRSIYDRHHVERRDERQGMMTNMSRNLQSTSITANSRGSQPTGGIGYESPFSNDGGYRISDDISIPARQAPNSFNGTNRVSGGGGRFKGLLNKADNKYGNKKYIPDPNCPHCRGRDEDCLYCGTPEDEFYATGHQSWDKYPNQYDYPNDDYGYHGDGYNDVAPWSTDTGYDDSCPYCGNTDRLCSYCGADYNPQYETNVPNSLNGILDVPASMNNNQPRQARNIASEKRYESTIQYLHRLFKRQSNRASRPVSRNVVELEPANLHKLFDLFSGHNKISYSMR